jgi:hypothetical protein
MQHLDIYGYVEMTRCCSDLRLAARRPLHRSWHCLPFRERPCRVNNPTAHHRK